MLLRLLLDVARATKLREGSEGVKRFLQVVINNQGIGTKDCARMIRLPLPVTAAVKKELVKRGILKDQNRMWLTEEGLRYCREELGLRETVDFVCQNCQGHKYVIPAELHGLLRKLEGIFSERPTVDVTIDQSFGTAETSLRRALLALHYGVLQGTQIAMIGDDDLVAVAAALLIKHVDEEQTSRFTVFDIDERLLYYIEELARREQLPIDVEYCDFREPVPEGFTSQYDAFFTDPPYTDKGCALFVSRGLQCLRRNSGLHAFLSYGQKSPGEMLAVQQQLLDMGLIITEILPDFNHYQGAAIIGSRSQMMVLTTTDGFRPGITGVFTDPFYTGELNRTMRTYRCKRCGEIARVGSGGQYTTIEELKEDGCPQCGSSLFELIKRQ